MGLMMGYVEKAREELSGSRGLVDTGSTRGGQQATIGTYAITISRATRTDHYR